MHYTRAIVRPPANSFAQGISTAGLGAPDLELARSQHAAYCEALESCGLKVTALEPLDDYPDCCFVEDTAVLLPEMAVITAFGADSRRGEEESVAAHLNGCLPLWRLAETAGKGHLEGGDVLQVGRQFFIGMSARTNPQGAEAFGRAVGRYGYDWTPLPVPHPPHLKTCLTWLGCKTLIGTPQLAGLPELDGYDFIATDPGETYAACCLYLNGTILMPANHPATRAKIERLGKPVIEVPMTEFEKMDGGLTCLSLRF